MAIVEKECGKASNYDEGGCGLGLDGRANDSGNQVSIAPILYRYDRFNTNDEATYELWGHEPNYSENYQASRSFGYIVGKDGRQIDSGDTRVFTKDSQSHEIYVGLRTSSNFGTHGNSDEGYGFHTIGREDYVGYYTIPAISADTPAPQTTGDVVYNPINGTGNLPTQTKEKDQTLFLHSDIPVRQGFVFKNGNTRPEGSGITYNPGDSYTINEPLMLFAQGEKTDLIIDNKKYVTKDSFLNFINSIKIKLIPRDIGFNYIINEGVFQSNNNKIDGTATSNKGWGQGRHGNDGTSEAGGYCGGQTVGSNTNIYMELPKGIFIDCPIMIMTPQIQDIQGAFPNYQDVHTITQSDIDSDSQGAGKLGVTYINSFLYDDTERGRRNFGVHYYLRGSWK